MSTPADTFATFVDRLAIALRDDVAGSIDGTELAARVGFSRFHLDRVIRSVAGENPGAFRRRILLERAAFRIRSSSSSLLEVAIDAGYSSHEAFTRAFARAFGAPPSSRMCARWPARSVSTRRSWMPVATPSR